MQTITATEFKNNFAEFLDKVVYYGEEFLIKRQGKIVAVLSKPDENIKDMENIYKHPLQKLVEYKLNDSSLPTDLAENFDKYLWEEYDKK